MCEIMDLMKKLIVTIASERLCRENFLHQALQEYAEDVLAERLKAFRLDTDRVRQAEVT